MDKIYLTNLQPDPQDPRDFIFEVEDVILPGEVDLRKFAGMRENQLTIGSCTAATMVDAGEMFLISAGQLNDTEAVDDKDLSILFNYVTSRKLLFPNGPLTDSGSTARMALKAAKNFGMARESVYPYDVNKVNDEPTQAAYQDAENLKMGAYLRISMKNADDTFSTTEQIIYKIQYALAKGWPVAVGLRVGEKLRTQSKDEPYSFVNPTINPYIGNHEMLIVGYKRDKYGRLCWIIENSWGKEWGDDGYFLCLAGVAVVDVIDLWVVQGFAGIERVDVDRTIPKPKPVPVDPPKPVPPAPEPTPPVPPKPEPKPEPVPPTPPAPKKDKDETGKMFGFFLVAVALIKKFGKRFERKKE